MKKNDLKASLGRIRPREELVSSTIMKVAEQKRRQERRFTLPSYSFGLRVAGAVCAFAIVFCIGFIAARQNINQPDVRTLGQLDATEATTDGISMLSVHGEHENGYILINGSINSMIFNDLTASDVEDGAVRRCKVTVEARGIIEKSENLKADLNKTTEIFEADVVFYDNDVMNAFFDQITSDMILRLVPTDNGSWSIVEFAPFEK